MGGVLASSQATAGHTYGLAYTYRLTSATDSGGWSRAFSYDAFGNMWVGSYSGVPLAGNTPISDNFSNNQIGGTSYDNAGNQLTVNGNTAAYDAENRMISVTEQSSYGGGTESFVYDGLGERVEKTQATSLETVYVYDVFGALVAEYNNSTTVPTPICSTCYLTGIIWGAYG